jgi:hypothetical protein
MIEQRRRRIVRRAVMAVVVVVLAYVGGYFATFWMCGRGTISVYKALGIESTAYLPVQLYRYSTLPGHDLVEGFRQWCFDTGQRSRE